MRKSKLKVIRELQVSDPCPISNFADEAEGAPQGWYCRQCERQVYNLAQLSFREIGELIERTNGDFCGAITRRSDGTIVVAENTEPSAMLRATGALITAATLIVTPAAADDIMEVGKIAVAASPTPVATSAPQVATPAAEPSGAKCEESKPQSGTSANSTAAPLATPASTGMTHTRGKVLVRPAPHGKSSSK